ncbi:MAG: 50S ribosomal protein L3 [Candidatus Falkowbacteria bacterium]
MKFIIGKKVNMTQVWKDGKVIAVTRVQAGPCTIVQIKNNEKDGYEAVQIGFGEKKEKNIKKPQKGHLKKLGNFRYLREFRVEAGELKVGDKIDVNTFESGDIINATGVSKGKGFQGVVKRHGFHGQDKTHGNKDQLRMPGSAGATGPAHVFKGMRMPGRMGVDRITTKNLEIVEVDKENNILLIKGSVPGIKNGLILIAN